MNPISMAIIVVLALAVIVSLWRVFRDARSWRWLRALGQLLMAALLYALLFPPTTEHPRVSGVVLTPGVTAAQLASRDQTLPTLALPGVAVNDQGIDAVPDLASGLREHPEIGNIEILGDGLPPRDRDALGDRGVKFSPGKEPAGVVEWQPPSEVRAGATWTLRGRLSGVNGAQVRLLDRSDALVATATPDEQGRFVLSARAKTAGESLYRLQVVDTAQALAEEIPVPLVVAKGDAVRTLILAGAPDAELKYLRRWILDSGNTVASRIGLSRGIEQRQNSVDLGAASLAEADLLIADERAWSSLSVSEKKQVRSAVEQGMGLVLRIVGPLSTRVRAEWLDMGFRIDASDSSRSVTLARPASGISLSRQPLTLNAEAGVALAVAADGSTLSAWLASGQGRIAVWLPLDSYRLQLQGDEARYGALWSEVFVSISRARGKVRPDLSTSARVGERSVVCGLAGVAEIEDAQGQRQSLLIDNGVSSCAAWWPRESGWHAVVEGESRWPLFVYSADDAASLMRVETRDATSRLARPASAASTHQVAMQRWPLFLIWLFVSASFWLFERKFSR